MYNDKRLFRATDPFRGSAQVPWRIRVYALVIRGAAWLNDELYDMVGQVEEVAYNDPLEHTPGLDDLYELGPVMAFDVVLNPITTFSPQEADAARVKVVKACNAWVEKVYAAREEQ